VSPITNISRRQAALQQAVPRQCLSRGPQIRHSKWVDGKNFVPTTVRFQPPATKFHADFDLDENSTPFEIVQYFWDGIVQEICVETNRYAEIIKRNNVKSMPSWKPLDREEFYKFMALSALMGIVQKSTIKDYWSTDELLSTPIFSKVMARDR